MFKFLFIVGVIVGVIVATPLAYRQYIIWDASFIHKEESKVDEVLRVFTPKIVIGDVVQASEFNLGIPIIDVRSVEEYDYEHIKGAISVPQMEIQSTLVKKLPETGGRVFVYGADDHQGAVATRLIWFLGYNAYFIEGGFEKWQKGGYKTERTNSMYF